MDEPLGYEYPGTQTAQNGKKTTPAFDFVDFAEMRIDLRGATTAFAMEVCMPWRRVLGTVAPLLLLPCSLR
jgi:hypothetical protein